MLSDDLDGWDITGEVQAQGWYMHVCVYIYSDSLCCTAETNTAS